MAKTRYLYGTMLRFPVMDRFSLFPGLLFPLKVWQFLLLFCLIAVVSASAHDHHSGFSFIENKGQWPEQVQFRTDIHSGALFLENTTLTYHFYDAGVLEQLHAKEYPGKLDKLRMKYHAFKVHFEGAHIPNISGEEEKPEYYNYFLGSDRDNWGSHARAFEAVRYQDLYPGVDLKLYTQNELLKYDFILSPGSNPAQIAMNYEGTNKVRLEDGNLIIRTSLNEILEQAPFAYQMVNGEVREVACRFVLKGQRVSFAFPKGYDTRLPLIIDPALIFSSYSGSTANNFGYTASFDSKGFLYTGSTTFGIGYPTVTGSYSETFSGGTVDIALSKFDTTGTFLIWSTYLGGNGDELPHSLIVNSQDELYIMGTTGSNNFPLGSQPYDSLFAGGTALNLLNGLGVNFPNGTDLVVAQLSAGGDALLASTYLGGTENDGLNTDPLLRYNYADEVRGEVMIDQQGDIYIVSSTRSGDFPIHGNPFQNTYGGGLQDGCIAKFTPGLNQISWSSFIGHSEGDATFSISIDNNNDIYIAGGTYSSLFPASNTTYQPGFSGGRCDGYITHITSDGSSILESTFFGSTTYDQIYFVELDHDDNVYVFGQTETVDSTFFLNALFGTPGTGQFVSRLTPGLDTLSWSTAFGSGSGTPNISPTAFLVDVCNSIYLSGWGGTTNQLGFLNNNAGTTFNLPLTLNAYQDSTDGSDFYLMVLAVDSANLIYGSYFGGQTSAEHVDGGTSRFDRSGKIYQSVCAGCGGFDDFPTTPNAHSAINGTTNGCNNGVFKMDFQLPILVADFIVPNLACAPATIQFDNLTSSPSLTTYFWDFGDNTTSTLENPTHTYTLPGTYTILLAVDDPLSCNQVDTIRKTIEIQSDTAYSLPTINICPGVGQEIGIPSDSGISYTWIPNQGLNNPSISNPEATPTANTDYTLLADNGVCVDTIRQTVTVTPLSGFAGNDTLICSDGGGVNITGTSNGTASQFLWSSQNDFSDTLNNNINDSTLQVMPTNAITWYYFKVISPDGCELVDSVQVTISDFSVQVDPEIILCFQDSALLEAINLNPNNPLTYQWSPTDHLQGPANQASVWVKPPVSTTYTVTTVNDSGCVGTDTVRVIVSNLVGVQPSVSANPDTILQGSSSSLQADPSSGYNYAWDPSGSLNAANIYNPTASPLQTTNYVVTISDPNVPECAVTREVTVVVQEISCEEPEIFIPNAFTPNGDGENDVLYVRGNSITEINLAIYNRWGEVVFESQDQNLGWDGTFKGKEVDPAVYVYHLEATCINRQKFLKKGNISVIR